jgi:hypothetical protein
MNTSVIDFAAVSDGEREPSGGITRGYLLSSSGTVQYLYESIGWW